MFSEISQVRFIGEVLGIAVEAVVSPDGAVDAAQCHPMHIIFIYHSSKAIVDEGWCSAQGCQEHLVSHDVLMLESGRSHSERKYLTGIPTAGRCVVLQNFHATFSVRFFQVFLQSKFHVPRRLPPRAKCVIQRVHCA